MKTTDIYRKWLDIYSHHTLSQKIVGKVFYALLIGFALLVFGHSLLLTLGHFLHVLISILEWGCEHLLHWLFKVSPRQAEIITFWLGVALLAGVARPIARKIHAVLKSNYTRWQARPKLDKYMFFYANFFIKHYMGFVFLNELSKKNNPIKSIYIIYGIYTELIRPIEVTH